MVQHRLFLSEYDVYEAIIQLKATGYPIENAQTSLNSTKSRPSRPEAYTASLLLPDGQRAKVSINSLSKDDRAFTGSDYALVFETDGDCRLAAELLESIRVKLSSSIPQVFWTMEHFLGTLHSPLVTEVATLTDNLILNGLRAAETVLDGFTKRERVHYEKPDSDSLLSYLRVEVKEDTFEYLPTNEFQIFQKDKVLVAVGITKESSSYGTPRTFLSLWFSTGDSESINGLFGRGFETALFSGLSVKGGKFTGDQKILRIKDKPTFDDMKLEPQVRDKIQREILGFFGLEPVYRKAGLPFKRGVALYGPPGTGKTMLAKILASTLEQTVVWVRAGDLTNTGDMNRVFQLARIGAPSVLILEDIDLYLQDRDNIKSNSVSIANMLAQLDGLEENDGVLVIVTTNKIETVEKAIVDRPGRIDSKIFMGELGKCVVIEILESKLKSFPKTFSSWNEVISEHVVMTGAQAVELSTTILRNSIMATEAGRECELTSDAVKKGLKDLERAQNAHRMKGFSAE